jgi:TolA-binding protein
MQTAAPSTSDSAVEAQVFWLRFQKEIAAALLVIVLGLAAFAGYRLYNAHRESNAASLLGGAKSEQDYRAVMERYSGAPAAASAFLLLAEKQRTEKKFSEANATLQEFVAKYPDHELASTAELAIAADLEAMGKTDEALAQYKQVAAKYSNNYNAPLAMISEVPLLKQKNRTEDARRVCEEILTKYRMPGQQTTAVAGDDRIETIWAAEAMRYLRSLKPPEQPKASPAAANAAGTPPPMIAAPTAGAPPPAAAPTPKKPR